MPLCDFFGFSCLEFADLAHNLLFVCLFWFGGFFVVFKTVSGQFSERRILHNLPFTSLLASNTRITWIIGSQCILQFFYILYPVQYYCHCSDGHQFWLPWHYTLVSDSLETRLLLVKIAIFTLPCLIIFIVYLYPSIYFLLFIRN